MVIRVSLLFNIGYFLNPSILPYDTASITGYDGYPIRIPYPAFTVPGEIDGRTVTAIADNDITTIIKITPVKMDEPLSKSSILE